MDPQFIVAVAMLLGGSILDWQSRRVVNRYWIPFLAAAAFFWWGEPPTTTAMITAAVAVPGFYLLWRLSLFGGADAKGLMVLALVAPAAPDLLGFTTILALDALVNGTFIMLALPIVLLTWNILRGDVRLPVALVGVRMELARARERFMWPMQDVIDGQTRWRIMQKPGVPVGPVFARLERAGIERPWVTPKIPFMIPLMIGLILAQWQGNFVLRLMTALVS